MVLSLTHQSIIEKARASGTGDINTELDDAACVYIIASIARDLNLLAEFPELSGLEFPEFYDEPDPRKLKIDGVSFLPLVERLFRLSPDADTYFNCLAKLHKSRLKYAKILELQPLPTMDQVGPRALLQYGQMTQPALAGFLFWRKWLFDIDNRAGQETGYLFEPILAHSLGGAPLSHTKSPIRRASDKSKGRQVDCLKGSDAYEFKVRVTIASSGQGRWREELDFPIDCKMSKYRPVLVVLDPTDNPKLAELKKAFEAQDGKVYIGPDAWQHLEEAAGDTMARFIEKYVRTPIQTILDASLDNLPELCLSMTGDAFKIRVGADETIYLRGQNLPPSEEVTELPEDVDEELPGQL